MKNYFWGALTGFIVTNAVNYAWPRIPLVTLILGLLVIGLIVVIVWLLEQLLPRWPGW